MTQTLELSQITHKTYAVFLKNIPNQQFSSLLHLIKHKAKWNPAINCYEYPLTLTQRLLQAIADLSPKTVIRDIPLAQIKGVMSHREKTNEGNKGIVYVQPRSKWNRILVLDPLLVRRGDFVVNFASGLDRKGEKEGQKGKFKRCLLLCWLSAENSWISYFEKNKLSCKVADYQSLTPELNYRLRSPLLKEHEFQILNYQKLLEIGGINKAVVNQFTTLICDDSEIWVRSEHSLYKQEDTGKIMKKMLKEFSVDKDLILIVSKVCLERIEEICELANLLKPLNFGLDPLLVARGEASDATWIKRRYSKSSVHLRELIYLLSSTILVNLLHSKQLIPSSQLSKVDSNSCFYAQFQEGELQKLRSLDNRYKLISKKAVLNSLQSTRSIGAQFMSQSSGLEEARYIRQLRELITVQKMPSVCRWLYHMCKELELRVVVIVQNNWGQGVVEKFLREQQISFVVYSVSLQAIEREGPNYRKFNFSSASVCLLNRQKVYNQCKTVEQEKERRSQEEERMKLESEFGLEKGGLFELLQYQRTQELQGRGFRRVSLDLQKITTVRHAFFVDTFWYDFSQEKQRLIWNILNWKSMVYDESRANERGRLGDDGLVDNWKQYSTPKPHHLIKHFCLVKNSYESSILHKYWLNVEALMQENKKGEKEESPRPVDFFWRSILDRQNNEDKEFNALSTVRDIDDEFDQLQFQAKRQLALERMVVDEEKPVYNTKIEGMIVETPLLAVESKENQEQKREINLTNENKVNISDISWLQTSKNDDSKSYSSQSEEEIQDYLLPYQIDPKKAIETSQNIGVTCQKKEQNRIAAPRQINSIKEPKNNQFIYKNGKALIAPSPFLSLSNQSPRTCPITSVLQRLEQVSSSKRQISNVQSPQRQLRTLEKHQGTKLWKNGNKQKIIGKKPMNIKVRLTEMKSSMTKSTTVN